MVTANSTNGTNTPLVLNAIAKSTHRKARRAYLAWPSRTYRTCALSAMTMPSWSGTALIAADHQPNAGKVSGENRAIASGMRMPGRTPKSRTSSRSVITETRTCAAKVTEATSAQLYAEIRASTQVSASAPGMRWPLCTRNMKSKVSPLSYASPWNRKSSSTKYEPSRMGIRSPSASRMSSTATAMTGCARPASHRGRVMVRVVPSAPRFSATCVMPTSLRRSSWAVHGLHVYWTKC